MSGMFSYASSFNQDISSWDISNVTSHSGLMSGARLSRANYDKLLQTWPAKLNPAIKSISFGSSRYCDLSARAAMAAKLTTSFIDGGLSPTCAAPTVTNPTPGYSTTANTISLSATVPAAPAVTASSKLTYVIDALAPITVSPSAGKYSTTSPTLTQGLHTLTAQITDGVVYGTTTPLDLSPITTVSFAIDTTPPVISGANDLTLIVGSTFDPLASVTATNNIDGEITLTLANVNTTSLDLNEVGSYTISYSLTDATNNTVNTNRTITIVSADKAGLTTAITEAQSSLANPKLVLNSDSETLESYLTDTANPVLASPNALTSQIEAVIIQLTNLVSNLTIDNQPPVLTLPASASIVVGEGFDLTNGLTATDNIDGDLTSNVFITITNQADEVIDLVDFNTNTANQVYTITYTITDDKNNTTTESIILTITEADKSLIAPALDNANNLIATDNYTQDSLDKLLIQINLVQDILDNPNSTQSDITQALANLQLAIDALEVKAEAPATGVGKTINLPMLGLTLTLAGLTIAKLSRKKRLALPRHN